MFLRFLFVLLPLFTATTTAYNPYQYDAGVSQFTPDGRLLQLEYAQKAADASPLLVARVRDDTIVVVAPLTSTLQRLTVWNDHTLLIWNGIVADAQSLYRHWIDASVEQRRLYGMKQPVVTAMPRPEPGIRPLGASWMMLTTNHEEGIRIWHTDPSGARVEWKDVPERTLKEAVAAMDEEDGTKTLQVALVVRGKGVHLLSRDEIEAIRESKPQTT